MLTFSLSRSMSDRENRVCGSAEIDDRSLSALDSHVDFAGLSLQLASFDFSCLFWFTRCEVDIYLATGSSLSQHEVEHLHPLLAPEESLILGDNKSTQDPDFLWSSPNLGCFIVCGRLLHSGPTNSATPNGPGSCYAQRHLPSHREQLRRKLNPGWIQETSSRYAATFVRDGIAPICTMLFCHAVAEWDHSHSHHAILLCALSRNETTPIRTTLFCYVRYGGIGPFLSASYYCYFMRAFNSVLRF
ncbi:hypothetical protein MSAN_01366000 [Mycena sanguinolenta]|uniref:Uncharacterized protein n=1 Tax=Mycena sanguinolenta TaxID=230812 RepID=A0A8H7CY35_9AGAR|nr:hypothetical protein MSAN_01366000 [Mycena sanguinolenta]